MFVLPGARAATISPSDLRVATVCEWALLREFDAVLGRMASPRPGPLAKRLAALGVARTNRPSCALAAEHRGRVVTETGGRHTAEGSRRQPRATLQRWRTRHRGRVPGAGRRRALPLGYADFLVRDDAGQWALWDAARQGRRLPALLQLAAGCPRAGLGGRRHRTERRARARRRRSRGVPLTEIIPVYLRRRDRLVALPSTATGTGRAGQVGRPETHACGRCAGARRAAGPQR